VKDDLPSYEIFRSLMGNDYIFVVENSDKTRGFLFSGSLNFRTFALCNIPNSLEPALLFLKKFFL